MTHNDSSVSGENVDMNVTSGRYLWLQPDWEGGMHKHQEPLPSF
jgi:hypothetical protein